ncbi:DUF2147 domain-containing protein [Methylosinus sporium]|uniref:DUF2147 domain-containing protein n=1 Tax=Methylosinus sporium TaxID=428 RepID=A0A549SW36_METSR|nr:MULTISPECIES: DUF2147 domain-containing protein [Methylosinus]MBU3890154.1 DUF2147 domain-containing protein [Methylosinus sp. KRF6]TRL33839.1 DUF2147 domain-containing protein [Methylosinus sporium]
MTRSFAREFLAPSAGALLAAAMAASPATGASSHDLRHDPRGVWLRPEGGVQFSFYDCENGKLCAKVVAAQSAEDRSAIGAVILRGARQTGPNEWSGRLFNVDDGKTYDGFITVESATRLTLKGCLWGMLCSDETWTRVSAPPAAHAMVDDLR